MLIEFLFFFSLRVFSIKWWFKLVNNFLCLRSFVAFCSNPKKYRMFNTFEEKLRYLDQISRWIRNVFLFQSSHRLCFTIQIKQENKTRIGLSQRRIAFHLLHILLSTFAAEYALLWNFNFGSKNTHTSYRVSTLFFSSPSYFRIDSRSVCFVRCFVYNLPNMGDQNTKLKTK